MREGDRKGGEGTGIQPEAPWVSQASGVRARGGQGSAWGQASECHGGRYFSLWSQCWWFCLLPAPGRPWNCGQGAQVWKEGLRAERGVVGDSSKW